MNDHRFSRTISYRLATMAIVLWLVLFSLVTLPVAQAATEVLGGEPVAGNLRVSVEDSGRIGIERYTGTGWQWQVYNNTSKGSRLQYAGGSYAFNYFNGSAPTLVSHTKVNANTVVTVWTASRTRVTQTVAYTNGQSFVRYQWVIENTSAEPITDVRFFHGQDTYLAGEDTGAGYWIDATKTVGARKTVSGVEQRMELQGVTVPHAYESRHFSAVKSSVNNGALQNIINLDQSIDNGYALEWRQASLAPGARWVISAFERFLSGNVASVTVIAPILIECDAGSSVDLIYTLTNTSSSTANVNLSATSDQPTWTVEIINPSSPATVPGGGAIQATVRVTVPAGTAAGTLGYVTLTADTGSGTSSDRAAVQVPNLDADLTITKTAAIANVDEVTFTIEARNLGPDAADGAVVRDTMPANVTNVTWTCVATGGASCTASGTGNIEDTLTAFPSGGQVTYTVSGTLTDRAQVDNTATITPPAGVIDPVASNNSATASATPPITADLAITKTVQIDNLTEAIFTIVVNNLGPDAANGAVVRDTLPANLTNVTWTCAATGGASCTASGTGNIEDTLTAFPSGGQVTYTLRGVLTNWNQVENTATVAPPAGVIDPVASNSSATVRRYYCFVPLVLSPSN